MKLFKSEEEVKEWLELVGTKRFFHYLKLKAKEDRDGAGKGYCVKDSLEKTGEAYILGIMRAELYEMLTAIEPEDLIEEEDVYED